MKIIIEINQDNAAFQDNDAELEKILQNAVAKLASGIAQGVLRDSNGNKVGSFTTEEN